MQHDSAVCTVQRARARSSVRPTLPRPSWVSRPTTEGGRYRPASTRWRGRVRLRREAGVGSGGPGRRASCEQAQSSGSEGSRVGASLEGVEWRTCRVGGRGRGGRKNRGEGFAQIKGESEDARARLPVCSCLALDLAGWEGCRYLRLWRLPPTFILPPLLPLRCPRPRPRHTRRPTSVV